MPMGSDVKNCLFGDVTLCCDIFLGGLFAFVLYLFVLLSCSAFLLCYDCISCLCILLNKRNQCIIGGEK